MTNKDIFKNLKLAINRNMQIFKKVPFHVITLEKIKVRRQLVMKK